LGLNQHYDFLLFPENPSYCGVWEWLGELVSQTNQEPEQGSAWMWATEMLKTGFVASIEFK